MANRHFGRIGDVWKHLPLAEVLLLEAPRRYWETHAGSALYPLTPSMERDYGVYHFWRCAPDAAALARCRSLARCRYRQLLATLGPLDRPPAWYPGSAYLAMAILGARASYLLADVDAASIASLKQAAEAFGLPRVRCRHADGVTEIRAAAQALDADAARATFVLVDPFYPFADTSAPITPAELFCCLAAGGIKAMLWYGFDSPGQRDEVHGKIAALLEMSGLHGPAALLWCGEISLAALGRPGFAVQPGTRGCGTLLANLAPATTRRCDELGEALAGIYQDTRFPGGEDGALLFSATRLW